MSTDNFSTVFKFLHQTISLNAAQKKINGSQILLRTLVILQHTLHFHQNIQRNNLEKDVKLK